MDSPQLGGEMRTLVERIAEAHGYTHTTTRGQLFQFKSGRWLIELNLTEGELDAHMGFAVPAGWCFGTWATYVVALISADRLTTMRTRGLENPAAALAEALRAEWARLAPVSATAAEAR